MPLTSLAFQNFRNLKDARIELCAGLNIITGDNGSGKSSLLEAIYILSRGRSFRTHLLSQAMRQGEENFVISGKFLNRYQHPIHLGIEKSARKLRIRVNGKNKSGVAALAEQLPVFIIHPHSHQLIEGGPKFRRPFLDWGVFHYDSGFISLWERYQRILKQRNAAIRQQQKKSLITLWDKDLANTASKIDQIRQDYCTDFFDLLPDFLTRLGADFDITANYQRGWDDEKTLIEILEENYPKDSKIGYTSRGAQRADLSFVTQDVPVQQFLSRGQQKLLATALILTQAELYQQHSGQQSIMLVDDLGAELDEKHRQTLISTLAELHSQSIVTAIESNWVDDKKWKNVSYLAVEAGAVKSND